MPLSHTDEGLRAAVRARGLVPGSPILVLSQYVEVSHAADLLADPGAGADVAASAPARPGAPSGAIRVDARG